MLDWLWNLFGPVVIINPLGTDIRTSGDVLKIGVGFKIIIRRAGRIYGYFYRASRAETPIPTPVEFLTMVQNRNLDNPIDTKFGISVNELYNDLLTYFQVALSSFHVEWHTYDPILMEAGPTVQDLVLRPGEYIVLGNIELPKEFFDKDIYGAFPSPLLDSDYFNFTCAFSPAGTRDTQDIRGEGVKKITVGEIRWITRKG